MKDVKTVRASKRPFGVNGSITYQRLHKLDEVLEAIKRGDSKELHDVHVPHLTWSYLENTSNQELCALFVILTATNAPVKKLTLVNRELRNRGLSSKATAMLPEGVKV